MNVAVGMRWVGTWACGPQLTEPENLPPASLKDNTLRQVVYVSIGGSRLRVQLSNAFGDGPVTMNAVHIAVSTQRGAIAPETDRALTFNNSPSVTIAPGDTVFSDPIDFELAPCSKLAISIFFGTVPTDITGHPGSRTNSYLAPGNALSEPDLSSAVRTAHWYFITGVDVLASERAAAIVILGDSITDGRGSTTDGNDRWPDFLSRRLRANPVTVDIAVLNQGIGGNAVVSGGLGPTALRRFSRDVLEQRGVRWVIVLEGVNDIGGAADETMADRLISAYREFIREAHSAGLLIYGVPILPFAGSQYYSEVHEKARQKVNDWIRTSGEFDAVIDLEAVVRDPANPAALLPAYDSGDHLHINPDGYEAMANAIDLSLFSR
ncbi:MAG: SGNH/GDSL hydrolase family protein [Firmicutes bacterium]|nr:SGNH/GDSL hydrolase family protein [Bacillota bacterium]